MIEYFSEYCKDKKLAEEFYKKNKFYIRIVWNAS